MDHSYIDTPAGSLEEGQQSSKPLSVTFLQDVFKSADKNDDGKLDHDEFMNHFGDSAVDTGQLTNAFQAIDKFNTGAIDVDTLYQFLSEHVQPFDGVLHLLHDFSKVIHNAIAISMQGYPAVDAVSQCMTRYFLQKITEQVREILEALQSTSKEFYKRTAPPGPPKSSEPPDGAIKVEDQTVVIKPDSFAANSSLISSVLGGNEMDTDEEMEEEENDNADDDNENATVEPEGKSGIGAVDGNAVSLLSLTTLNPDAFFTTHCAPTKTCVLCPAGTDKTKPFNRSLPLIKRHVVNKHYRHCLYIRGHYMLPCLLECMGSEQHYHCYKCGFMSMRKYNMLRHTEHHLKELDAVNPAKKRETDPSKVWKCGICKKNILKNNNRRHLYQVHGLTKEADMQAALRGEVVTEEPVQEEAQLVVYDQAIPAEAQEVLEHDVLSGETVFQLADINNASDLDLVCVDPEQGIYITTLQ